MAKATMADLLKQADEAGISSWEPTNGEKYELEVIGANAGRTKKDAPKFGFQLKVISGPDSGKSFWTNMSLTPVKNDGTPNSMGLALTFKDLAALGADSETVAGWDVDAANAKEQVEAAVKGNRITAEVLVRESNGYTNTNLKSIKPLNGVAPSPTPAPVPETDNKPF